MTIDLEYAREKHMAQLSVIRADVLDILKLIGIEPAGTMTFADDLLAIRRYIAGWQDGLSAIVADRDKAESERDELTAMKDALGQKAHQLQDKLTAAMAVVEAARHCTCNHVVQKACVEFDARGFK